VSGLPAAREEIVALRSYRAGEQVDDSIRLNANEAPSTRDESSLNRYPEIRPASLQRRLAELFGVAADNLLVTRGSSEAIDVLMRAWCPAYRSSLITTPPTFDMYRVYADVQGARRIEVPLTGDDFGLDVDALLQACEADTRLVFLCSPNNPTGSDIPESDLLRIATVLGGRSVVVVDEAYVEFAGRDSLARRVTEFDNLVILRTLSKAFALAGARCGAAIASAGLIDILGKVLPPYSFATPVTDVVLDALSGEHLQRSRAAVAEIITERDRVERHLATIGCVERVWPSRSNFLLVRFRDLPATIAHLAGRRILVRDFGSVPGLADCARITIGSRADNDALLAALADFGGHCG